MSPEEFSLIAARPEGWRQLLFALAFKREIGESAPLRRRWHDGFANEPPRRFAPAEYRRMAESRADEARRACEALEAAWKTAVGPGLASFSQPEAVLGAARAIGEQYRALLAFKPAVLAHPVPPELAELREQFSRMCDAIVHHLEMAAHGHSARILAALIARGPAAPALQLPSLDLAPARRLLDSPALRPPGRA